MIESLTINRVYTNTTDSSTLADYSLVMRNNGGGTINQQFWITVDDTRGNKKYHPVWIYSSGPGFGSPWDGATPFRADGSFVCTLGSSISLQATADGHGNVIPESNENNNQFTTQAVCALTA